MRLPKTVNICGKTYTVRKDKKLYGGRGGTGKQEIVVGTEFKKDDRHFENLIHEIMEVITCERHFRYSSLETDISDGSVFVMTHKEFCCFAADVATALLPMIKE